MKLYTAVLNNGGYNAEKLSKQLNKTKANLAHEKQYLIENILKALRNYHDKQGEIELYNTMSDALLLKERRINLLTLNKYKKAESLARQYGKYEIEWRMLFERRLFATRFYSDREFIIQAEEMMARMQQLINRLGDFQSLQQFYLKVESDYRTNAHARGEEEISKASAMLNDPVLKRHSNEPLFKYFQLDAESTLNQRLLNDKPAIDNMRSCLKLAEKYPEQLSIDSYYYFTTLHGYLVTLLFAGKFKEFENRIKKIQTRDYHKLPFNHTYLDKTLDAHYYYYYLILYNFLLAMPSPPLQKIKSFLAALDENYEHIIGEFPAEYAVLLPHYACGICFVLKDYNGALRWNRRVIDESGTHDRHEVLSIARIVTLILHAEMKNYSILPFLATSAKRYLIKQNFFSNVEKTTLSFLTRLPQLHSNTEVKKAYRELFSMYKELEQTREGEYHLRTFKYRLWAQRNM
ncbi:MAG TPA: hypothetical protein VK154_04270 [Chitinophagales bacterium]|nr:hypothetical protein [Chitinophagales bacterium]